MEMTLCDADTLRLLEPLLARYGLEVEQVPDGRPIPGSWFGEPEAGLVGNRLMVRADTPLHSALHESCHYICMDSGRRRTLHTDAGGGYDEENGVCYLQILLADHLPGYSRAQMFADMDSWGYSFRLGSARAWFEQDAGDALEWLLQHGLVDASGNPTWILRE
jgi:hypothetical protein